MKFLVGTLILGLACAVYAAAARGDRGRKDDARVFELRTYHAAPGKMDALHARFKNHTNKLFRKHGMRVIGFWTPIDPEQAKTTLIYLLAFPSKEEADRSWQAFRDDPVWKAVKEESEKDGKLVDRVESVYLNPTDYSPLK